MYVQSTVWAYLVVVTERKVSHGKYCGGHRDNIVSHGKYSGGHRQHSQSWYI